MYNVEGDAQVGITQDVDSRESAKPAFKSASKTKKFDKSDEWNFDD